MKNGPLGTFFIDVPIGSMHDAYSRDFNLSVENARNYHQQQINILKKTKLIKALGIALTAEEYEFDYTVGFI